MASVTKNNDIIVCEELNVKEMIENKETNFINFFDTF